MLEYPFYHVNNKIGDAIAAIRLADETFKNQKSEAGLSQDSVVQWCELRLNAKFLQEKVGLLVAELAPLSL